jgi:hypothetical protein
MEIVNAAFTTDLKHRILLRIYYNFMFSAQSFLLWLLRQFIINLRASSSIVMYALLLVTKIRIFVIKKNVELALWKQMSIFLVVKSRGENQLFFRPAVLQIISCGISFAL